MQMFPKFLLCPPLVGVVVCTMQLQDLRETTRVAIDAYDSSLLTLQFEQRVSFDGKPPSSGPVNDGTLTFYAEDAHGRRAVDLKVYESGKLVFRDAAYFDKQGYHVAYQESNPERMESVRIEDHWAGDAARIGLPYALQFLRTSARQQPWKSHSDLLVTGETESFEDKLVVRDSSTDYIITLYPDPAHAFLPSRVSIQYGKNRKMNWLASEFAYVSGRWFPKTGIVESEGEQPYKHYWSVSELKIGTPIAEEVFRPVLNQAGVRVDDRVRGETYFVGGQKPSPVAESQDFVPDRPSTGLRVSQPWNAVYLFAYGLGTLSITILLYTIVARVRARRQA